MSVDVGAGGLPESHHGEYRPVLEDEFNNGIREITIFFLVGAILSLGAYSSLILLRRKTLDEDLIPNCWEDEIVYKISFTICCFAMAVSAGSALLLPISSISNEILHRYPHSWYIKWLNTSLIHGIWNLIFVLSNLSLFVFLPFAYLFCESEGFVGYRKGLLARAKETLLTLLLLSLIILGMMYVMAALIDWDKDSFERILHLYSHLPLLYSWVSFLGVLVLLLCTPLGFARLFTIMGELVVNPLTVRNAEDEYHVATYEEQNLQLRAASGKPNIRLEELNRRQPRSIQEELKQAVEKKQVLQKARESSFLRRTFAYPLIMVSILLLTIFSLLCVVKNVGMLVSGFRSLPVQQQRLTILGSSSLSSLGIAGVALETILIGYLSVTSLVGLYSIPFIRSIQPSINNTSLTRLILNCGIYVILSSALPLLAKILGITNFDLLGSFGKMKWLGNFYLVLLYNAIFACAAVLCLVNKFTSRMRQELISRLKFHCGFNFAGRAK